MLLAWIHQNIEAYGGDINTIVLIGNSLGATHIATYLFHEPSQLDGGPGVAAVVLSSGAFDDAALSEVAPDYFARRDARSMPLALVETYQGQRVPTLLWNAEYDMPSIQTSVARMYAALCEKYNGCPMFAQLYGFNHVSHIMSIGSEDNGAMNAIMRFYHSVR
jgi:triacylglycerol lipase